MNSHCDDTQNITVPRPPEGIIRLLPIWLVDDFTTIETLDEFRMWWTALAEAVQIATDSGDPGLVQSVAVKLGTSPADRLHSRYGGKHSRIDPEVIRPL